MGFEVRVQVLLKYLVPPSPLPPLMYDKKGRSGAEKLGHHRVRKIDLIHSCVDVRVLRYMLIIIMRWDRGNILRFRNPLLSIGGA